MEKKIRTAKARQEDAALNRALLWVAAAVILEALLMLVNRYYINFYTTEFEMNLALAIGRIVQVGTFLFLVLAAAGAVWCRKRRQEGKPVLLSGAASVGLLLLSVFCGILWVFYDNGVTLLFVLVPAMAALALVYYLYQKECFMTIALTALGIFGMWLVRKGSAGPYLWLIRVYLAAMLLVSLAALVMLICLKKREGALSVRGKEVRVLSKKASYPLLLLTCVIMLAAFAAALAVSAAMAYYLIFVLIAWAFILVVYYTVQLL